MTRNAAAREAMALAKRLKPMLAAHPPQVQSGAIAELMAAYLGGWQGSPNVKQMRQELFDHFEMLVWQLVAVSDEHAAGEHDKAGAEP